MPQISVEISWSCNTPSLCFECYRSRDISSMISMSWAATKSWASGYYLYLFWQHYSPKTEAVLPWFVSPITRLRARFANWLEGPGQPLFRWRLEVTTALRPTKQGYPLVSRLGNRFEFQSLRNGFCTWSPYKLYPTNISMKTWWNHRNKVVIVCAA